KPNPGSIMSYCGGPNGAAGLGYQMRMTFLPQNIALMRQSAESAACITAPPEPSVVLVSPRGSQSFSVRSPLTIEYLSTRVAAVSFDVSYDEGRSWRQIIGDADPLRGSMQWTPPDTCSNSVMMRVRSTEDSSVSDVTTLPFALYREAPSGLLASYDFAGDYVNSVCGGFDNAIAVNGEVKFVADRFGLKDSAIAVNGAGYLVAPKADLRSPALSVSLWCRPDSLAGKNTIIGTNYAPATNVFEIYHWGILGCSYYLKTGLWQFWGGGLAPGQWAHVVFSYDGSTARTWINNRLVKTESKPGTLIPFITSLYIGSRKGSEPFYGVIDDIKVFDRAVEATDVEKLYTEKRAADAVQLIAPGDGAEMTDRRVTFRWTASANATRYRLNVARDAAFTQSLIDTIVSGETCTLRVTGNDVEVHWRVQALNTFGASGTTASRSLRMAATRVADESAAADDANSCMRVRTTAAEIIVDLSACTGHNAGVDMRDEADAFLADVTGRAVWCQSRLNGQDPVIRIPAQDLARGVYMLRAGPHSAMVRVR
ncbi:MAG: LamG domain-containing protein, partial [Candidatus Kapaibacterium sp.]